MLTCVDTSRRTVFARRSRTQISWQDTRNTQLLITHTLHSAMRRRTQKARSYETGIQKHTRKSVGGTYTYDKWFKYTANADIGAKFEDRIISRLISGHMPFYDKMTARRIFEYIKDDTKDDTKHHFDFLCFPFMPYIPKYHEAMLEKCDSLSTSRLKINDEIVDMLHDTNKKEKYKVVSELLDTLKPLELQHEDFHKLHEHEEIWQNGTCIFCNSQQSNLKNIIGILSYTFLPHGNKKQTEAFKSSNLLQDTIINIDMLWMEKGNPDSHHLRFAYESNKNEFVMDTKYDKSRHDIMRAAAMYVVLTAIQERMPQEDVRNNNMTRFFGKALNTAIKDNALKTEWDIKKGNTSMHRRLLKFYDFLKNGGEGLPHSDYYKTYLQILMKIKFTEKFNFDFSVRDFNEMLAMTYTLHSCTTQLFKKNENENKTLEYIEEVLQKDNTKDYICWFRDLGKKELFEWMDKGYKMKQTDKSLSIVGHVTKEKGEIKDLLESQLVGNTGDTDVQKSSTVGHWFSNDISFDSDWLKNKTNLIPSCIPYTPTQDELTPKGGLLCKIEKNSSEQPNEEHTYILHFTLVTKHLTLVKKNEENSHMPTETQLPESYYIRLVVAESNISKYSCTTLMSIETVKNKYLSLDTEPVQPQASQETILDEKSTATGVIKSTENTSQEYNQEKEEKDDDSESVPTENTTTRVVPDESYFENVCFNESESQIDTFRDTDFVNFDEKKEIPKDGYVCKIDPINKKFKTIVCKPNVRNDWVLVILSTLFNREASENQVYVKHTFIALIKKCWQLISAHKNKSDFMRLKTIHKDISIESTHLHFNHLRLISTLQYPDFEQFSIWHKSDTISSLYQKFEGLEPYESIKSYLDNIDLYHDFMQLCLFCTLCYFECYSYDVDSTGIGKYYVFDYEPPKKNMCIEKLSEDFFVRLWKGELNKKANIETTRHVDVRYLRDLIRKQLSHEKFNKIIMDPTSFDLFVVFLKNARMFDISTIGMVKKYDVFLILTTLSYITTSNNTLPQTLTYRKFLSESSKNDDYSMYHALIYAANGFVSQKEVKVARLKNDHYDEDWNIYANPISFIPVFLNVNQCINSMYNEYNITSDEFVDMCNERQTRLIHHVIKSLKGKQKEKIKLKWFIGLKKNILHLCLSTSEFVAEDLFVVSATHVITIINQMIKSHKKKKPVIRNEFHIEKDKDFDTIIRETYETIDITQTEYEDIKKFLSERLNSFKIKYIKKKLVEDYKRKVFATSMSTNCFIIAYDNKRKQTIFYINGILYRVNRQTGHLVKYPERHFLKLRRIMREENVTIQMNAPNTVVTAEPFPSTVDKWFLFGGDSVEEKKNYNKLWKLYINKLMDRVKYRCIYCRKWSGGLFVGTRILNKLLSLRNDDSPIVISNESDIAHGHIVLQLLNPFGGFITQLSPHTAFKSTTTSYFHRKIINSILFNKQNMGFFPYDALSDDTDLHRKARFSWKKNPKEMFDWLCRFKLYYLRLFKKIINPQLEEQQGGAPKTPLVTDDKKSETYMSEEYKKYKKIYESIKDKSESKFKDQFSMHLFTRTCKSIELRRYVNYKNRQLLLILIGFHYPNRDYNQKEYVLFAFHETYEDEITKEETKLIDKPPMLALPLPKKLPPLALKHDGDDTFTAQEFIDEFNDTTPWEMFDIDRNDIKLYQLSELQKKNIRNRMCESARNTNKQSNKSNNQVQRITKSARDIMWNPHELKKYMDLLDRKNSNSMDTDPQTGDMKKGAHTSNKKNTSQTGLQIVVAHLLSQNMHTHTLESLNKEFRWWSEYPYEMQDNKNQRHIEDFNAFIEELKKNKFIDSYQEYTMNSKNDELIIRDTVRESVTSCKKKLDSITQNDTLKKFKLELNKLIASQDAEKIAKKQKQIDNLNRHIQFLKDIKEHPVYKTYWHEKSTA